MARTRQSSFGTPNLPPRSPRPITSVYPVGSPSSPRDTIYVPRDVDQTLWIESMLKFKEISTIPEFLDLWSNFYSNQVYTFGYFALYVGAEDNDEATFEIGKQFAELTRKGVLFTNGQQSDPKYDQYEQQFGFINEQHLDKLQQLNTVPGITVKMTDLRNASSFADYEKIHRTQQADVSFFLYAQESVNNDMYQKLSKYFNYAFTIDDTVSGRDTILPNMLNLFRDVPNVTTVLSPIIMSHVRSSILSPRPITSVRSPVRSPRIVSPIISPRIRSPVLSPRIVSPVISPVLSSIPKRTLNLPYSKSISLSPQIITGSMEAVYKSQTRQDHHVFYLQLRNAEGGYTVYKDFNQMCLSAASFLDLRKYVEIFSNTPGYDPEENIRAGILPWFMGELGEFYNPNGVGIGGPFANIVKPTSYVVVSSPEKAQRLSQCLINLIKQYTKNV